MPEVNTTLTAMNPAALDVALRAAVGAVYQGLSTYGPTRPISVWLSAAATSTDHASAIAICAVHDPVTISADKAGIAANGTDAVTITVNAVSTGAPVTLVVTQPGGSQVPQAVPMVGGIGTLAFNTAIPGVYSFAVQNGANRCNDVLTVTAT